MLNSRFLQTSKQQMMIIYDNNSLTNGNRVTFLDVIKVIDQYSKMFIFSYSNPCKQKFVKKNLNIHISLLCLCYLKDIEPQGNAISWQCRGSVVQCFKKLRKQAKQNQNNRVWESAFKIRVVQILMRYYYVSPHSFMLMFCVRSLCFKVHCAFNGLVTNK